MIACPVFFFEARRHNVELPCLHQFDNSSDTFRTSFPGAQIFKKPSLLHAWMADLNDQERAVLRALGELEPATLHEIASRTGITLQQVQEILDGLAKKGLLSSVEPNEDDANGQNSGTP